MICIADLMSRLCRNNMLDFPEEYSLNNILCANIITKFKLSSDEYKIISSVVVAIFALKVL